MEIERKQFAFDELDDTKESRHLNDDEKLEKYHIYIDLEKTILLEEICVRQKSKVLWLREGDKNIKFSHRVANFHRQCNAITNLLMDGELTTDLTSISKYIMQFYCCLYIKDDFHHPFLDVMDFNSCRHCILYLLRLRPPFLNDAQTLRLNVSLEPNWTSN